MIQPALGHALPRPAPRPACQYPAALPRFAAVAAPLPPRPCERASLRPVAVQWLPAAWTRRATHR
eukprot:10638187-Lingulodinium_polyedra.AAC.1